MYMLSDAPPRRSRMRPQFGRPRCHCIALTTQWLEPVASAEAETTGAVYLQSEYRATARIKAQFGSAPPCHRPSITR